MSTAYFTYSRFRKKLIEEIEESGEKWDSNYQKKLLPLPCPDCNWLLIFPIVRCHWRLSSIICWEKLVSWFAITSLQTSVHAQCYYAHKSHCVLSCYRKCQLQYSEASLLTHEFVSLTMSTNNAISTYMCMWFFPNNNLPMESAMKHHIANSHHQCSNILWESSLQMLSPPTLKPHVL